MRRAMGFVLRCGLPAAGAALLCMATGCEDDDSVAAGEELRIEPAEVTLTPDNPNVTLRVIGNVHRPVKWSVDRLLLGTLTEADDTAVYTRTAQDGVNTVIVTDSLQWKASARIYQKQTAAAPAALTVSPASPSLGADGDQVAMTASGGVPPYNWTVADGVLGHLVSGTMTATTVVYTRDRAGSNTLILQDDAGSTATAAISQP